MVMFLAGLLVLPLVLLAFHSTAYRSGLYCIAG
jgi:hypothetical protein